MTKNELLALLKDLPGDTVICGFNSEFSTEYDVCTAVLVREGSVVGRQRHVSYEGPEGTKRTRKVSFTDIRSPKTVLVLTEFGDSPDRLGDEAETVWSKS